MVKQATKTVNFTIMQYTEVLPSLFSESFRACLDVGYDSTSCDVLFKNIRGGRRSNILNYEGANHEFDCVDYTGHIVLGNTPCLAAQ